MILEPAVAGSWYPADGEALSRVLDDLDGASEPAESKPGATALIAPHAGLRYSGEVAARGFRELRTEGVERVLLLGPSHHFAFDDTVLPEVTAFRTPLGDVPVDRDAVDKLRGSEGIRRQTAPFEPEHSLEIELPFLQRSLPAGWRLLPLLVGAIDAEGAERLADALAPLADARSLIVVSSDFTHYGRGFGYLPFTDDVPDRIEQLDHGAIDAIERLDAAGFEAYVERTGATICGQRAIAVALRLLAPGRPGALTAYDRSGTMTGDWEHSVSYASVAFREAGS